MVTSISVWRWLFATPPYKSSSPCWYLFGGEEACVSQGLWELYRRGLKPLAGLTKPGRSQGRDQTKPSTWSSTETTTMKTTTRGPIADLSKPGSMTTPAQSLHQEGRCATDSLLGPKTKISIGTWNVRTMNEASKLAQVIREMKRYRLDILGVSECRWTGSGRQVSHDGSTILHSGHEDIHIRGVAFVISKQKANTLLEWEPISDRIMKARFNSKHCKLTIILCYAPTNASDKEDKEDWYEQLQQAVAKVPQHDMLLIIGDMNDKVGSDNSNCERAMGKHGCGVMNDNGERLVDYCLNNNYVIGGTIFAHRDISTSSPGNHLMVGQAIKSTTLSSMENGVGPFKM